MLLPLVLDFAAVRSLYASGEWTPLTLMDALVARIDAADPAIFINRVTADDLRAAVEALITRAPEPNSLPLWGMPCAVKDNIDVAGLPTTAACPEFAYMPAQDATVVARLRGAGAIILGKTNLDRGCVKTHQGERGRFRPDGWLGTILLKAWGAIRCGSLQ